MDQPTIVLIIIISSIIIFLILLINQVSKTKEGFYRGWGGRGWGRGWGGRRWSGGWGWGGYPYYLGVNTSWPPYLYETPEPKCVDTNAASDCPPSRPVKVGYDTNNDGKKDTWSCCKRW